MFKKHLKQVMQPSMGIKKASRKGLVQQERFTTLPKNESVKIHQFENISQQTMASILAISSSTVPNIIKRFIKSGEISVHKEQG